MADTCNTKPASGLQPKGDDCFCSLLSNIPGAVYRCTFDDDWTMAVMSDPIEEICGYPASDFVDNKVRSFMSVVHPGDAFTLEEIVSEYVACGQAYAVEHRVLHADGSIRWVWNRGRGVVGATGNICCLDGVIFDITERKRAEERLLRAQTAVDAATDAVVVVEQDGSVSYINMAFGHLFRCTPDTVGDEDWDAIFVDREQARAIFEAISEGHDWNGELQMVTRDDRSFLAEVRATPILDHSAATNGMFLMINDITAKKRMESQALQTQKLESIGQLAAGIAHEINTPTQYIGDNTQFLQEAFQDLAGVLKGYGRLLEAARTGTIDPQLLEKLQQTSEEADVEYLVEEIPSAIGQALEGIERVSEIVRAMKEFSHPGVEGFTEVNLNDAIRSTVTVASNEWKYVADVELDLDERLPLVSCRAGEINQVVLNLLINAAHAIVDVVGDGGREKGTITIATRCDGQHAEIRLSDTGRGIPEGIRDRIFDPFFTTKEVGKGTGQGLAIAHTVVAEKHGGTIECETEVGKGTTFLIRLPLVRAVPDEPSESEGAVAG